MMVYFSIHLPTNMFSLLLMIQLVHARPLACPPAPRILHPDKGIGHCNGTCHDVVCVGYNHPEHCFHWECKAPYGVSLRIPPPSDTIHANHEAAALTSMLVLVGLCSMFALYPHLTIGIVIGAALDDDYEFDS